MPISDGKGQEEMLNRNPHLRGKGEEEMRKKGRRDGKGARTDRCLFTRLNGVAIWVFRIYEMVLVIPLHLKGVNVGFANYWI